MRDERAISEFMDSRLSGESEAKTYRRYIDRKYQNWLVSVDALARGRENRAASEPIRRMEITERDDYGKLQTGIELLREALKARDSQRSGGAVDRMEGVFHDLDEARTPSEAVDSSGNEPTTEPETVVLNPSKEYAP